MASQTGISFLNLDDRTVQIQLAQGTIEVHLRRYEPGNAVEIDTPNLAFTLTGAGEYRIETDANGDSTLIIVREGGGQVTGGGDATISAPDSSTYLAGRTSFPTTRSPRPVLMISKTGASSAINARIVQCPRICIPRH